MYLCQANISRYKQMAYANLPHLTKVDIGQGSKCRLECPCVGLGHVLCRGTGIPRRDAPRADALDEVDEGILGIAGLGTFAAHANGGATDSLSGLFALTTKHGWIFGNAGGGLGEEGTGRRGQGADGLGTEGGSDGRPGD